MPRYAVFDGIRAVFPSGFLLFRFLKLDQPRLHHDFFDGHEPYAQAIQKLGRHDLGGQLQRRRAAELRAPVEFTCEHTTDSFAGVSLANDEPLGITLHSSTRFFSHCLSGPTSSDRSSTRSSASPSTCSFSRWRDAQPPGDFRQRPAVLELLLNRHAAPLGELPVLASRHSLHLPSPECRRNDGIRWDSGGEPLLSETKCTERAFQIRIKRLARGIAQLAHRARHRAAALLDHVDGPALLLFRVARHSRTPNRTDWSNYLPASPYLESIIGLVGAVMAECDEDWPCRHAIANMDLLEKAAAEPANGAEAAMAERLVFVAMESAGMLGKAA